MLLNGYVLLHDIFTSYQVHSTRSIEVTLRSMLYTISIKLE